MRDRVDPIEAALAEAERLHRRAAESMTGRDAAIVRAVELGATRRRVSDRLGFTRGRVTQIVTKHRKEA